MYVDYTGSYIYPVCGVTTDEAYTQGNTAPTAYFIKLLDGDSNNRTYPHRAGFIPRVTSRVWVVDYYSDWVGLATVHGVGLLNLNANSYRSGPWAKTATTHSAWLEIRLCTRSATMKADFMEMVSLIALISTGLSHTTDRSPFPVQERFPTWLLGVPFLTAVQSASHYYNAWETVLPAGGGF